MTTGKTLKLIAYMNRLSECLKNPINFTNTLKDKCICIEPNTETKYTNLTKWNGENVYINDGITDEPNNIRDRIRRLSGDMQANVSFRAVYKPYDDEHKNPEYEFSIIIDDECFTVNKYGWS